MIHKLSAWTGPTMVTALAEKCREAGLRVTVEGTEKVYVEVESVGESRTWAGMEALALLRTKHNTDCGLIFC
jgi:hypothetical protein